MRASCPEEGKRAESSFDSLLPLLDEKGRGEFGRSRWEVVTMMMLLDNGGELQ